MNPLWTALAWLFFMIAGIFADKATGSSEVGIAVAFFGFAILCATEGICCALLDNRRKK